jgi:alkanesulfonate monooxygenase SsuD/methylene tetrahydromethanopterin reductase-like flavin-dependent oxidoreductase (luciferase family)
MTQLRNAVGKSREWWGLVHVVQGPGIYDTAKMMEDIGFDGLTALQIYAPPFAPLAVAAAATKRARIATGIAVAATRSPLETAMLSMDMDRISNGRFILGLGTGVLSVNMGSYGLPEFKMVAHLRDTVKAVRHIVKGAHKGLEPYEGTYFKADFKELMQTAPPVREAIPIWIAALRDKVLQTALELADGLMLHALWSPGYSSAMVPTITESLRKYGRKREDIEINAWPWVAINNDQRMALDDARPTVAAYAGIKAYENFFEARGFLKEARICQEAEQNHGNVLPILNKVPDEMVKAFCACGSIEQVLEQLEPYWDAADSICPMTPYRHLSMEKMMFYGQGIFQLVAAAKQLK